MQNMRKWIGLYSWEHEGSPRIHYEAIEAPTQGEAVATLRDFLKTLSIKPIAITCVTWPERCNPIKKMNEGFIRKLLLVHEVKI